MSSQRSAKPSKPPNQQTPSRSSSSSSSLSSHLAMIELKQRILTSLSKLADRDTHQIAMDDFDKIIHSLSNDGVSMLLNCLFHAISTDPKPAVKKESLRLLSALCAAHADTAATHLTKIIDHIVRRLKDSDSQVRDACRDSIGSLAGLYLRGGDGVGVVSLFVKPLFELMGENNKVAQSGGALCLAKMVESAPETPLVPFQKLCNRVCKYLNSPNFMAKAQMLQVASSLSQVGAIAPQSLEPLLQSIHELLSSSDWATRKAAADALIAISMSTSNITPEGAASTLEALEACKFDKIKPVRESMTEALQRWKKLAGKGDGSSDENKASSHDGEASESSDTSDHKDVNAGERESEKSVKESSSGLSPTSSNGGKGSNYDKAVGILKKKASALTEKELNPEFFQKLETRGSVEVIVPRGCVNPNNSQNEEESESNNIDPTGRIRNCGNMERGAIGDRGVDGNQRESSTIYPDLTRSPGQSEGFMNNKGNWLAIQRQLLQLERQQTHLMHMLQDFMGGSHDSMITLENRVRGLERVVEDMARDLSLTAGRRAGSNMVGNKYNGFPDYSSGKLGRGNDGRINFGERFSAFDGIGSSMKGWDYQSYGKNGHMGSRRGATSGGPMDIRSGKLDNEPESQIGSRRGWEKGAGPVRFGEGPSARSVWQASKDEATLEAIRVAGEDNGAPRTARVAMPEMTPEALEDDGGAPERDPVWNSWSNAMDALHVGDVDSAFAIVLSTGDDFLLVKLMDKSGPIIDQLSNEVASEVLHAVSQFLMEQNLFDMCLYWVQQVSDLIMEHGPDVLVLPMDLKKEMLLNLHDACSSTELPEDWDGSAPDHLILQLASAWQIDLQNLGK